MNHSCIKALCALIPVRSWRKRSRDILLYGRWKELFIRREYYDGIFSLGEACFVATSLKRAGLRSFSGPFDWVADSSFEKRVELLRLAFPGFFRRQDLKPTERDAQYAEESSIPHAEYINKHTGLRHPHDFPFHGEFEQDYPDIAAKYERRCKRLIHLLNTCKRVLIVYGETDIAPRSLEIDEVAGLLERLQTAYPASLDLLYLKRDASRDASAITLVNHRGGSTQGNLYFARYKGQDALERAPRAKENNERLRKALSLYLIVHFGLKRR